MRSRKAPLRAVRSLVTVAVAVASILGGVVGAPMTASANSNPLTFQHGGVITTPKVYVVFWGSDWHGFIDAYGNTSQGAMNYIKTFFGDVGGSRWLDTLTQYYDNRGIHIQNPTGQLKGEPWLDDVNVVPGTFGKNDVATEADRAAHHFNDVNNLDAVFFVFTGLNHQPTDANCGGYHDAVVDGLNFIAYAYLPYCTRHIVNTTANDGFGHGPFDYFSVGGGHEYAEALTNPTPAAGVAGWYTIIYCTILVVPVPCDSEEIGDKCATSTNQDKAYGDAWFGNQFFAVQPLWSNSASGCTMGAGWHTIDRLQPNEVLRPGQELVSLPSNRYVLVMQGDGNLVLYSPTTYLWASWTQNRPGAWAVNQGSDGNFVVYSSTNVALWYSHTQGHIGDVLVMQDDGNAVIYAPGAVAVWSSRTCCYRA